MIERYHFLKLTPEYATPARRAEVVEQATRVLATVPGVVRISAGVPGDAETTAAWDVVIVVRFATMDDVEAYRPHPIHRQFVDEWLAPRLAAKRGWMFQVRDGDVRPR